MFGEFFVWLLERISNVFDLFRNTKINGNFTYLDFIFFLNLILVLIILLKSIMVNVEDEKDWLRNKQRNEEYREYQNKLKSYEKERKKGGS